MMARLTAKQYRDWVLYNAREPFGYPEDDAQHSFTRMVLSRSFGATKKNKRPLEFNDVSLFRIREDEEKRQRGERQPQSVEEMKELLMGIARVQNKSVRK